MSLMQNLQKRSIEAIWLLLLSSILLEDELMPERLRFSEEMHVYDQWNKARNVENILKSYNELIGSLTESEELL